MGTVIFLDNTAEAITLNLNNVQTHIIKINAESFSKEVIDLVWRDDIPYFEAITHLMNVKGLEPEHVAKLLTADLKAELTIELENTNTLPKSEVNRLFK